VQSKSMNASAAITEWADFMLQLKPGNNLQVLPGF
jgi:hypothetical protein